MGRVWVGPPCLKVACRVPLLMRYLEKKYNKIRVLSRRVAQCLPTATCQVRTFKHGVVGSSPTALTKLILHTRISYIIYLLRQRGWLANSVLAPF
jgi:hypothetical protein